MGSSAAVRMTTFGLVTSVPPMANVMVIQTTHVGASKLFPQMDSIANQYIIKVSTIYYQTLNLVLMPNSCFFSVVKAFST